MLKSLLFILFLNNCSTSNNGKMVYNELSTLRYKVGQCTYLVDPENGQGKEEDAMRVEEITSTHYIYRWYTYQGEWAIDTNTRTHERYEHMTKPLECP